MILNGIRNRIYARLNLVAGTLARTSDPNGRRALFYRDANNDHWPLRDYLKMKLGLETKMKERIGFLGEPGFFRELVKAPGSTNRLSRNIRLELFELNKLELYKRRIFGIPEVLWDADGIKICRLSVEPKTGTYFYRLAAWGKVDAS